MTDGIGRAVARGALASMAGVVAMDLYFKAVKRVGERAKPSRGREKQRKSGSSNGKWKRRFEDISLVGPLRKENEPATVTVGRIAYEKVRGEQPSRERGAQLGKAVHWGYGVAMGALWGLFERRMVEHDIRGGVGYGLALWLLGDELLVPLLGLAKGPTAHPPSVHAQALGAHLVYGLATGAATRVLDRVM